MKPKTKLSLVNEMIVANKEEILKMEIVHAFQTSLGTPQSRVEADAANQRIKKADAQLAWLTEFKKTLKS